MSRRQAGAVALSSDGANLQTVRQRIALQRIPDSVWRRAIASGALVPPYNYRAENRLRVTAILVGICLALCAAAFVVAAVVKA